MWLADRVDAELQTYRERHDIDTAVGDPGAGGRGDHRLPGDRAADPACSRMARRAKAELVGIHVRRDDGLRARGDSKRSTATWRS